jgi:type VI secretion system secreted protein VgrG
MATTPSTNGSTKASPAASAPKAVAALTLKFDTSAEFAKTNPFTAVGWTGTEGISKLFRYELDLVADPATPIAFEKVLGQFVTLEIPLPSGQRRVHGIISRLTEEQPDRTHAHYRAEMTSRLWLATKVAQSRVFQDLDAVEIIKAVLDSLPLPRVFDVYQIQGRYPKRPYCVQYRETDFIFLNRLMEEEGIYYYFDHDDWDGIEHLVISDKPLGHPEIPEGSGRRVRLDRDSRSREEDRLTDWRKTQELRAGRSTLWDHSFEFPQQHLEATKRPTPSVRVGSAIHRLDLLSDHELYDYPGGYAKRFDGVNRGGGDQVAKLQGVFEDNQRTAAIRAQQEALPGLVIHGAGAARIFRAGYTFSLEVKDPRNPSQWTAGGQYLITAVQHHATQSADRSGKGRGFKYDNQFSCVPVDLPFRPLRHTPKPVIQGMQTAVVVGGGAKGEEIFTDKYGRVKVRFFWDRRGPKTNPDSCWIRVAQASAGKRWGTSFWPRVGQEVVVAFEEGDPDKPIILGSVYNAEQMPPYLGDGSDAKHRNDNKVSGVKTCTTPEGDGFNEIRFDDTRGREQVFIRSQNALDVRALGSQRTSVGGDCHLTVSGHASEKVGHNKFIRVGNALSIMADGVCYYRTKVLHSLESEKDLDLHGLGRAYLMGNVSLRLRSLETIELECGHGKSRIVLTPQGIWLNGPQVFINSGSPPAVPDISQAEDYAAGEGFPGAESATYAADDSKPGFVSNGAAAQKTLSQQSPDDAPAGQAGG